MSLVEGHRNAEMCIFDTSIENFTKAGHLRFTFMLLEKIIECNGVKTVKDRAVLLGGRVIRHFKKHEVTPEDIEELKKKLTRLYKVDGTVLYFPDNIYTCNELRDLLDIPKGDWLNNIEGEWFTMTLARKRTPRFYAITYDWAQKTDRKKVYNAVASQRLHKEFYGDVLYINENFVS